MTHSVPMRRALQRLDYFVLKPLAVSYTIWGLYLLWRGRFSFGLGLILLTFLVGFVGQSASRYREFADGSGDPEALVASAEFTFLEGKQLTKAIFRASWIFGAAAAFVTFQGQWAWYWVMGIGFVSMLIFRIVVAVLIAAPVSSPSG